MAEITTIICDKCRNSNQYEWYKGIKYVCQECKKEIDFLSAIFDGRVSTNSGILEKKAKKKKR